MRSVRLVAVVASVALALSAALTPVVAGGGNSDAAHACQQGGYATLQGTDGTKFANTGECVAFVARGGAITGVTTACTYVSGVSGCIEFANVKLYLGNDGTVSTSWTTLSGMFTFSPITSWTPATTVTVSGSGTWVTSTALSGTWTATGKGYYFTTFDSSTSGLTTCAAADNRWVGVRFELAGGGVPTGSVMEIQVHQGTGVNYVQYQAGTGVSGEPAGIHTTTDISGVTLRC